jgi:hypothetical protein
VAPDAVQVLRHRVRLALPDASHAEIDADLRLRCTAARDDEADFTIEVARLALTDATADPAAVRALIALVPRMSGQGRVGRLGDLRDLQLGITGDPSPLVVAEPIKYVLGFLGPLFPEEAVGVGARWEHPLELHPFGLRIGCVTRFKLQQSVADRVTVDVEAALSTAAQTVMRGEGEAAVRCEVAATTGMLHGTITVRAGAMYPTGKLRLRNQTRQTVHRPEGSMTGETFESFEDIELTIDDVA